MNDQAKLIASVLFCALSGCFAAGCASSPSMTSSGNYNEDRYRSKVQVLALSECPKIEGLRRFETQLFQAGFIRERVREDDPVPFELIDRLLSGQSQLIEFRKLDFKAIKTRGSNPYDEIVNRYKLAACEEPAGGLYLIIVRHDPDPTDRFLGARMSEAFDKSGCQVRPVAPPRDLGFYNDAIETDLIRHITRGLCRDYATGR